MDQVSESSCAFCAIVDGETEASVVYEDERALAFMDICPATTGHLLVIPKTHAASLQDLDPETGADLFRVAQRLAAAVRESGIRCEGVNLFLADGEAAGQEVFHTHLHVLPRHVGDGFGVHANFTQPARAELDVTADQIRAVL